VHSNASIRKLLEKEAKKLLEGGVQGPVISVVKDGRERTMEEKASNLPYLHRNPAV
jgi:hypothetical protein